MSRRKPPAKWVLPAVVDPPDRICYVIAVPNEPQHIAAFNGALLDLASAMQWADDEAHTAKDVALVWRAAIDDMTKGECDMIVQFRQPDLCTLEASYDGGATWSLIYDANACVINGANELIAGYLADGTLGGSQPSPQGTLPVYFCKSFRVTLQGDGTWISPIPIKANYRITITNVQGITQDGATLGPWRCGSGELYLLGQCAGSEVTNPADVAPAIFHQRLIMRYNSTYFDAYNLIHNVSSALVGEHDLTFMINDSVYDDNAGDLRFDLEICNFGACEPVFSPTDYITVSYNGDEITLSGILPVPGANGAYQAFGHIADGDGDPCPCKALQIISLTGYQWDESNPNHNGGGVFPCGMSFIFNTDARGPNWQTFYNGLTDAEKCIYDFDIKSETPFTIVFKIIDCP